MELAFSIHDLFNIRLKNPPDNITEFISNELWYFETKELANVNLEIEFVERVRLPDSYYVLLRDLFYKDGIIYFKFSNSILRFPIKDIQKDKIKVKVGKKIPELMILYLIEKLLHLKILEHDYCILHAFCVKENKKVSVFSGWTGIGKTNLLFEKLERGAKFISDDMTIVSRSGTAYCYPRRVNIHKYHEKYFYRTIPKLSKIVKIRESIRNNILTVLGHLISYNLLFYTQDKFHSGYNLKEKIREVTDKKRIYRLGIKEIFPSVEIIKSAQIDKLKLMIKTNDGVSINTTWDSKRVINYLIRNTHHERLEFIRQYLDVYSAFGDKYNCDAREYIERLLEKEKETVSKIVTDLDTEGN